MAAFGQGLECRAQDVLDWTHYSGGARFSRQDPYVFQFYEGDLKIWDISDPASAELLCTIEDAGGAGHGWIEGDRLYIDGELKIFDVSDIRNPVFLSASWTGGTWLEARGMRVFWVNRDFVILNTTNPNWVTRKGIYHTDSVLEEAVLYWDLAYIAADDGVHVVDFSDMHIPVGVGIVPGFRLEHIARDGNLLATLDRNGEVVLYDMTTGILPDRIGTIEFSRDASEIELRDGRLFVADGYYGLRVFDVSNPMDPIELGRFEIGGLVQDFAIFGEEAKISSGLLGTATVDLSRLAQRPILGSIETGGDAMDIAALGSQVIVADGMAGLAVYDIADPANPVQTHRLDLGRECRVVVSEGDLVVVAHPDGVTIIDYSNTTAPMVLATIPADDYLAGVTIDGDRLALANWQDGARLFDISHPTNPTELVAITTPLSIRTVRHVVYNGHWLYVIDDTKGMLVYDISDPVFPEFEVYDNRVRDATQVELVGGFLYVSSHYDDLTIFDCADPSKPRRIEIVDAPDTDITAFAVRDDRVYVNSMGVALYDVSDHTNAMYLASTTLDSADAYIGADSLIVSGDVVYGVGDGRLIAVDVSACTTCIADLTDDGTLDFFDLQLFLNLFVASDPQADFVVDGLFDFFDLQAFLQEFSDGCS